MLTVLPDWLSLMIRHDLDKYPGGLKRAKRSLTRCDENINKDEVCFAVSVFLSESDCAEDKLFALKSLRMTTERGPLRGVVWLVPHLRVSVHRLRFDGHPRCITNPLRIFVRIESLASLNLAILLLEVEGKEEEAVIILEGVMNTELRLVSMLNLAHILMNEIQSVEKDWNKGISLLEDAVRETNDASARLMLANALAQRADTEEDLERAWKLWRSVEEEEDEDELQKLRRLISADSEEKWG